MDCSPEVATKDLRRLLNHQIPSDRQTSYSEAFRNRANAVERADILVMVNGVVGDNTHRKLNPA